MFSHDITNFEAYCNWWAFLAWESPTISMRKPGKKHNQIDVRLQCNTPKKKLLHTVKCEVVLLLAGYFQFWHSKVHEHLPMQSLGFWALFCPDIHSRRSQSMRAKAYGSVLISGSNLNLFMGFC